MPSYQIREILSICFGKSCSPLCHPPLVGERGERGLRHDHQDPAGDPRGGEDAARHLQGRARAQLQLRAAGAPRLHPLPDLPASDQRRPGTVLSGGAIRLMHFLFHFFLERIDNGMNFFWQLQTFLLKRLTNKQLVKICQKVLTNIYFLLS